MIKGIIKIAFVLGIFCLGTTTASAQKDKKYGKTRILFIFDASNSMNGKWDRKPKIETARKVLVQTVDSLKDVENIDLALRIYGHQTYIRPGQQDCNDTKLEVPFKEGNHQEIITKINNTIPKGTTPIALSLEKSGNDFPDTKTRNVIILITDGIEACDGDPCAIGRVLKEKKIVVKPFIVGIGRDIPKGAFNCIGSYFDAADEKGFQEVMKMVISQALNNTTAEVDLLDTDKKPLETNNNFSLYNAHTGALEYSYVHTLNYLGNPDTLVLNPAIEYNLVVHTIPQVKKNNIKLTPGEHNKIKVDAPQGYLSLNVVGANGPPIKAVIRESGKMQTLFAQPIGTKEKYLTGNYDLEVLTLPRLYFNDVTVRQSKVTTIDIPESGMLSYETLSLVYGAIYKDDKGIDEWVCNLDPSKNRDNIRLLPGKYKIVYRQKKQESTLRTETKRLRIYSGESINLKL